MLAALTALAANYRKLDARAKVRVRVRIRVKVRVIINAVICCWCGVSFYQQETLIFVSALGHFLHCAVSGQEFSTCC